MLMSAGLELPRHVWAHGFVLLAGDRFSKSAGVQARHGRSHRRFGPDAFRYFLLREVPFDGDGNFSWERFEERYNSDLANSWGNFASRTISMVEKYRGGVVPSSSGGMLDDSDTTALDAYHKVMSGESGYRLQDALAAVWKCVAHGNEFVGKQAPWAMAKDPARSAELDATLSTLIRSLARQTVALAPFMPGKTAELWKALGAPGVVHDMRFDMLATLDPSGWRVKKPDALFPRVSPDKSGASAV